MASIKLVHYFINVMSSFLMAIINRILIDEEAFKGLLQDLSATKQMNIEADLHE